MVPNTAALSATSDDNCNESPVGPSSPELVNRAAYHFSVPWNGKVP